jgi:hypothetical protein
MLGRSTEALRAKLRGVAIAAPLLEALEAIDLEAAIAEIVRQLDQSFLLYAERLASRSLQPITKIRFYWAGAEIAPWVPSVVMGNVYAGRTLLLDSCGGFDPTPLEILCDALADTPELGDDAALGDLEHLFIATSLELAARAVTIAARGGPFAALSTARPFDFVATPGHDTENELLLRLE